MRKMFVVAAVLVALVSTTPAVTAGEDGVDRAILNLREEVNNLKNARNPGRGHTYAQRLNRLNERMPKEEWESLVELYHSSTGRDLLSGEGEFPTALKEAEVRYHEMQNLGRGQLERLAALDPILPHRLKKNFFDAYDEGDDGYMYAQEAYIWTEVAEEIAILVARGDEEAKDALKSPDFIKVLVEDFTTRRYYYLRNIDGLDCELVAKLDDAWGTLNNVYKRGTPAYLRARQRADMEKMADRIAINSNAIAEEERAREAGDKMVIAEAKNYTDRKAAEEAVERGKVEKTLNAMTPPAVGMIVKVEIINAESGFLQFGTYLGKPEFITSLVYTNGEVSGGTAEVGFGYSGAQYHISWRRYGESAKSLLGKVVSVEEVTEPAKGTVAERLGRIEELSERMMAVENATAEQKAAISNIVKAINNQEERLQARMDELRAELEAEVAKLSEAQKTVLRTYCSTSCCGGVVTRILRIIL